MLSDIVNTSDYTEKLNDIKRNLSDRHQENSEQVDFFTFLLRSAAHDFVFGDYERSFLDNYILIHDETLRPAGETRALLADRITVEKRDELRRDRVFLMHGILEERPTGQRIPITPEDILRTRKQIFSKSLEMVQLAFCLAERI